MDALPQHTPSVEATLMNQEAADIVLRQQEAQRWLADQQDALPEPPASEAGFQTFHDELTAFWDARIDDIGAQAHATRRNALGHWLAKIATDDARLRANDGTLDRISLDMIRELSRLDEGALPAHLHASELLIGRKAQAGSLVLHDDRHPDIALLFSSRGGWETFPSLDTLYRDVEVRMREYLALHGELPGLRTSEIDDMPGTAFVGARAMNGRAFSFLADRLIEYYSENVDQTLSESTAMDPGVRMDAIHAAMRLHDLIDVHGMLVHRDMALLRQRQNEALLTYPEPIRETWHSAFDTWMAASARYNAALREGRISALPPLSDFAQSELAAQLSTLGIPEAPEDIAIRRYTSSARAMETTNLLQLAFDNVVSDPIDNLTVLDSQGKVHRTLTSTTVRRMVRDVDLGARYVHAMDALLGDTAIGMENRQLTGDLYLAGARLAAASARLDLHDGRRSGLDPSRAYRSYRWIMAVLDTPSWVRAPRVDGHEIKVQQLTYRGAALPHLFLIAGTDETTTPGIILYTPDAPDGVAFREFANREAMEEDFIHQKRFETYLLDHLPMEFASEGRGSSRRFNVSYASHTWQWATGGTGHAFCTELEEAFGYRDLPTDLRKANHDAALALLRRNTLHLTRSNAQADAATLGLLLQPFGSSGEKTIELATAIAHSIPQMAQSSWRLYDNVKAADYSQAFLDMVNGYTAALNVIPMHAIASPSTAGGLMRSVARTGRIASHHRPLASADTLFEKKFLAGDISLSAGAEPANGVYQAGGAHVIRQKGRLYSVRFDADMQGWRLTRQGVPDSRVTGPLVERLADGTWQFRRAGLLGGSGERYILSPRYYGYWLNFRPYMSAAVADLSWREFAILQQLLIESVGRPTTLRLFQALGRQYAPEEVAPVIEAHERAQWHRAMRVVRRRRNTVYAAHPLPEMPLRAQTSAAVAGTSTASTATADSTAGSSLIRVPRDDIPAVAYYYASPAALQTAHRQGVLVLPQASLVSGTIQGIPLLSVPPWTPLSRIGGVPEAWLPPRYGAAPPTLAEATGAWVRIELAQVMRSSGVAAQAFQVYRPAGPGSTAWILRPTTPPGFPGGSDPLTLLDHFSVQSLQPL